MNEMMHKMRSLIRVFLSLWAGAQHRDHALRPGPVSLLHPGRWEAIEDIPRVQLKIS